ncbi:hypothetical protein M0802_005807 [Mischocyttarus mexicanus]|nr:hypothetical protein M0802_005807 [Mischocyttarus mexicanus]
MAEETPIWLSFEFMQSILRKVKNDDSIQVIGIFSKPATAKGDNYTSDMYRVSIDITSEKGDRKVTKKESFIVKAAPSGDTLQRRLVEESKIFNTEMSIMMDLLKKMNNLVGPTHILSAETFYVKKEYPEFLVIEDLATRGFRMTDRQAGLDLAHSMLTIQGLARFHASSLAVCEKEPYYKTLYQHGLFYEEQSPQLSSFFTLGTKTLATLVKEWPNFEKYAEKIDKIWDKIYNETSKVSKFREDEFNVINHGDAWINNMLYRYDEEGKPIDHTFVDFQMCVYGSPALDLQYFLSTSPKDNVYENDKDKLLDEYYSTLCNTMKKLDCKTLPPSRENLDKSMKKHELLAMACSFTVLPFVLQDKKDAKHLNEIMNGEGYFNSSAFKSDAYFKIMSRRIPYYDQLGLLDF